jgi:hypothetical protein
MWTDAGTPRMLLRYFLSQMAVTAPVATEVRRVNSAPSSASITARSRDSFESAIGQLVTSTTSFEPAARYPTDPLGPPTTLMVVR